MFEIFLLLLIILVAYLVNIWVLKPKKLMKKLQKTLKAKGYQVKVYPYSPLGSPQMEEMLQMSKERGDPFFHDKNDPIRYDATVGNALNRVGVSFRNPELIKDLTSPDKIMNQQKVLGIFQTYYSILRKGIVCTQKDGWKHRRKILSQVFNFDFIVDHIPRMVQISDRIFAQFQKKGVRVRIKKGLSKIKVDFYEMMTKYTSSIVISGFLGIQSLRDQVQGMEITEAILKLNVMAMGTVVDPLLLLFGQKLYKRGWRKFDREFVSLSNDIKASLKSYVKRYEETLSEESSQEKKKGQKSIVELLLKQRMKNQEKVSESVITDEELIDEIKTFVIAGSQTTSNFLVALFFYVFEKPEVAKRLRQEINEVIQSDRDITVENMKKIPYMEFIILEVSRKFGGVPGLFTRQLIEDTVIGDMTFPKGAMVDANWMGLLYNPKVFQNPQEFIPERWQKEQCRDKKQLVSMIFSAGPRSCIGKSLAITQMKVMMIKLMKRYEKVSQKGLKERAYDLPFTIHIRNCQADLVIRKR